MSIGINLVIKERERQLAKGYDSKHDDLHCNGEIGKVAELVLHAVNWPHHKLASLDWEAHIIEKWQHDPVRMLTIAAALLVAEIERINRLNPVDLDF